MKILADTLVAILLFSSAPQTTTELPVQENSNLIVFEQTIEEKKIEEEKQAKQNQEVLIDSFDYEVSSYSTKYSTSAQNSNRNHNMKLACNAIDNLILYPGDTFSYNGTILSKRDLKNDYLPAPILSNGQTSTGIGGGICQISSTLYNTALYSNMTITNRRSHSAMVGYVPAGRDTTVSWGTVDFCFRNDLDMPVMIDAHMNNGIVTIKILSQDDPALGEINVTTAYNNGTYTLNRSVNGSINHTTKSSYR